MRRDGQRFAQQPLYPGPCLAASFAIGGVITVGVIVPSFDEFSATTVSMRALHSPDLQLLLDQSPAIQSHVVGALGAVLLGATFIFNRGMWSYLHAFSGWVMVFLPLAVLFARRHQVRQHRALMMMFFGSLLISGALAFLPGRLMWRMFFG